MTRRTPSNLSDALRQVKLMTDEARKRERAIAQLVVERDQVVAERDRYRDVLRQIADSNSPNGWVAFEALHPERAPRRHPPADK